MTNLQMYHLIKYHKIIQQILKKIQFHFGSNKYEHYPIIWLPNGITHLEFGTFFNQSIEDAIPKNVKNLKFGNYFNQKVYNYIPDSVTHLKFG